MPHEVLHLKRHGEIRMFNCSALVKMVHMHARVVILIIALVALINGPKFSLHKSTNFCATILGWLFVSFAMGQRSRASG